MKLVSPPLSEPAAAAPRLPAVPAEAEFYREYEWCLNPCLTVREALDRLAGELRRLDLVPHGWQRLEVLGNIFLLGCSVLNSVDDYLRGPAYHVPWPASHIPLSSLALKGVTTMLAWKRTWRVRKAAQWRAGATAALDPILRHYVTALSESETSDAPGAGAALLDALKTPLPADLLLEYTHLPSAFRKLDLAPHDILTLGRQFMAAFPDRQQPVLAAGLRTAGSYFGPLLCALLRSEGYRAVAEVTFRPDRGLGAREHAELKRYAAAGYRPVLLDDPPVSGETLAHAADILRQHGFPADRIVTLLPIHARQSGDPCAPASARVGDVTTLSLEPDRWHKAEMLTPMCLESRLRDYFEERGYRDVRIVSPSEAADRFNHQLAAAAEEERRTRLKRVCEVRLDKHDGTSETRFVLAKSVGWGYLGYHAFLAGSRLGGFVPPLLGLRDGLLFTEWIPQETKVDFTGPQRSAWLDAVADYVAARVRRLPMPAPATLELGLHKHSQGFLLLEKVLSKAYGNAMLAKLMRSRVRRRVAAHLCPVPTLIDAKMRPAEWIATSGECRALLKTDFEHHGMGKNELNVVDPAYDLAEAILQLSLTPAEETRLLQRYRDESGDATIGSRLFLYKLLAGLWTMAGAMKNLQAPPLAHRQIEFHQEYVRAWDYLTVQSARHCGRLVGRPTSVRWGNPLVVLDVDGVIDRRLFGYPATTAAGIQALALLHAHGLPIALNTARSVAEVKEYCQAYGCAGAVAEYGSYLWDAVTGRGIPLVSNDVIDQVARARKALARLPGVFLNDGYEYSLRACTYEYGVPVPLPTPMVQRLLADEKLDRLTAHQTSIDSTFTAADLDKGTGLTALLEWVGLRGAETMAIGDSEPDLAMFRVASRSFAPSHIGCARSARLLGCRIAPEPQQRGFLHIVRSLVHPDGGHCDRCVGNDILGKPGDDLFIDLLRVADEKRSRLVRRALMDRAIFDMFAN